MLERCNNPKRSSADKHEGDYGDTQAYTYTRIWTTLFKTQQEDKAKLTSLSPRVQHETMHTVGIQP